MIGGHDRAGGLRADVADAGRDDEDLDAEEGGEEVGGAARVAPAVRAAGAPQVMRAEAHHRDAGRDRQQAAHVAGGESDLAGVVDGVDAGGDPEQPGGERQQALIAATQPWIEVGGEPQQREREEAAEEVVGRAGAGRRLQEVVVDDAECDQRESDAEHARYGPSAPGPLPPGAARVLGCANAQTDVRVQDQPSTNPQRGLTPLRFEVQASRGSDPHEVQG